MNIVSWTRFGSGFSQRRGSAMVNGLAGHLRTHLYDLLQTHKLYLIVWKIAWIIVWLYLVKQLQLRSFLWISRSCKPSSCVFGALAWKIWPVSDCIIFWGQSRRYSDYWRIFANSLRVELHSMFWHSIILDKISLRPRLWRFLDKCCHSTEHLFKHTKPSTTWINRYVHPGVS